jgi:hypothetical protein
VPPPPSKPGDADVLFPKESEALALAADDALTAKVLRLRALDKEINARTAEAEMLEFEIKLAMKDAEEMTVDVDGEVKVSRRLEAAPLLVARSSRAKEDHPQIHKRTW